MRWWPRTAAVLAGFALSAWIAGCGSVSNKTDASSGAGGATGQGGAGAPTDGGTGGAPGDGAANAPADGAAGARGDGAVDQVTPPPDGGGTGAKWDIDNWDNAQWS